MFPRELKKKIVRSEIMENSKNKAYFKEIHKICSAMYFKVQYILYFCSIIENFVLFEKFLFVNLLSDIKSWLILLSVYIELLFCVLKIAIVI